MSLGRVCDKCGCFIKNAENMHRVKLQSYDDNFTSMSMRHMACADICIDCCRELFNCFIDDDDWNDILYSGLGKDVEQVPEG